MHGFLFYSDHPDCTLLPQAQHIAAALPEYLLDGCMVPLQQPPAKPPPCIRHAPSLPCRMLWLRASAMDSP